MPEHKNRTDSGKTDDTRIKRPRFTEIPTFMRAPLSDSLDELDIALIGVPMDLGVTNRAGARHGPREIRNASSLMRVFNVSTGINPYDLARIADVGDVPIENLFDLDAAIVDIIDYYKDVADAGVIPLSAGGDHSITYPIFRGIAADQPVGMVHIDAHTDTWAEFFGSKFHHGAPFRLAVEDGLLDPRRTIQIGIRGGQNTLEGLAFSRRRTGWWVTVRPTFRSTSTGWIRSMRRVPVRPRSAVSAPSMRCSSCVACGA